VLAVQGLEDEAAATIRVQAELAGSNKARQAAVQELHNSNQKLEDSQQQLDHAKQQQQAPSRSPSSASSNGSASFRQKHEVSVGRKNRSQSRSQMTLCLTETVVYNTTYHNLRF